ncbi:protein of unknown function [Agreia sp. COWG]|nr:protein of unknown function [Agreia sp. COWG]
MHHFRAQKALVRSAENSLRIRYSERKSAFMR